MPIDPSIYNMLRPVQAGPGPMELAGSALQLRHLLDQGELHGLQREQLTRGMDKDRRIGELFAGGGEVTPEQLMAIDPERGLAYRKTLREEESAKATRDKAKAETFRIKAKNLRDLTARVVADNDLALVREAAFELGGPQAIADIPASVNDPSFKAWQAKEVMDADKFIAKIESKMRPVPAGGRTVMVETNPNAPGYSGDPIQHTMSPGDTARLAEAQATNLQQERISAERLRDETGINTPGRNVTIGAPTAAPAAPAPAAPPVAQPPAPVAPAAPRLTPKQEREQAAEEAKRSKEVGRTLNTYVAARNGLLKALSGTETGPIIGRMPAVTAAQQVGEGGVAAMGPVLKQLFRVAGEGVFTDRDQALLMDMIPKRTDEPEARAEKIANIDAIVAAKLGVEVPKPPKLGGADEPKTFDALPDPAQFKGKIATNDKGERYQSDGARWVRMK